MRNLRKVQCFPFHPCEQTQVPFLHWPCSEHLWSHGSWSHLSPVHPCSQRHLPWSQVPWRPQSRLQRAEKEEVQNVNLSIDYRIYPVYSSRMRLKIPFTPAVYCVFSKHHVLWTEQKRRNMHSTEAGLNLDFLLRYSQLTQLRNNTRYLLICLELLTLP